MSRVRVGLAQRVALVPLWNYETQGRPRPDRRPLVVAFAAVDAADRAALDGRKYTLSSKGYAWRQWYAGGRKRYAFLHREVLGGLATGAECVDHINHVVLDNTRVNLRPATHGQNSTNRRTVAASGYRGVYAARGGLFTAAVKADGVRHHLGTFASAEAAARAYDAAARQHHGAFAMPNFPDEVGA